MYIDKILSIQNLESFNFEETKKKISNFFVCLEKLQWQWEKLNAQKGLTANYDFSVEYKRQPYIPFGKDVFGLSVKDYKEEQIKQYISNYYWAENILSDMERLYIKESFVNRKNENEFIDLLGFNTCDSRLFKKLKKSAIFKFADFLNLVVEK